MKIWQIEPVLRRLVMGTPFESYARFVWKRVFRQKTKNDIYDQWTIAIMDRTLLPESNCIDVGCHEGTFLDHMLRLSPRGAHYAFEPLPQLFAKLRTRYSPYPNVVVSDLALSDRPGITTFHANRDHPAYSGIKRRDYPSEKDRVDLIEVRTDRLDAVVPAAQKIDFIKIDVEGAELLVFQGAREHLQRDRPVIVFEHGLGSRQYYDSSPQKVLALLELCGLRVSLLDDYLRGNDSLSLDQFVMQVEKELNYYFVAHP